MQHKLDANALVQYQNAAKQEAEHHKKLLAEGWLFDSELGRYTHPDTTDEIWIG